MTEHKNVYAALAAAQMEMGKAVKDAENPHFRSRYADLAAVVAAVRPALNAHGIAFFHIPTQSEFGHAMETVLFHGNSETSIKATVPLILGKQDMQGYKSATTYAKRIGLESVTGIAPDDDDDGNAAAGTVKDAGLGVKTTNGGKALTWAEEVIKDLPPTATEKDKAEALRDAIFAEFKRKTTLTQLDNEWDRRAKLITSLAQRFPDIGEEISGFYEQRTADMTPAETLPMDSVS